MKSTTKTWASIVALAFASAVLAMALTACGSSASSTSASSAAASASSAAAKTASAAAFDASAVKVTEMGVAMQKMSADDVLAAIESGDKTMTIVDLRNTSDVEASTIEGSVAASMQSAVESGNYEEAVANLASALKDATGSEVGGDNKIVLVCYTGNKYAQAATDALSAMGANMANVYTLDGGAKGWAEAGKPMTA